MIFFRKKTIKSRRDFNQVFCSNLMWPLVTHFPLRVVSMGCFNLNLGKKYTFLKINKHKFWSRCRWLSWGSNLLHFVKEEVKVLQSAGGFLPITTFRWDGNNYCHQHLHHQLALWDLGKWKFTLAPCRKEKLSVRLSTDHVVFAATAALISAGVCSLYCAALGLQFHRLCGV